MKVKGLSLFLLLGAVTVIVCDSTFVVDRKKNQTKTENTFTSKQTTIDDTSQQNGERTVRKRGVLYNRSGLGSVSFINYGPKNYPAHHSFHKSATNAHLNYKRGLSAASFAHAPSFVLRPGGAVVQSYSANFPQYYFQSHSGHPPAAVAVGAATGAAVAYPGYSLPPAAHGSSVPSAHQITGVQAFALPQHHPILSHNYSPIVSIPSSLEPFHHQQSHQLIPASVQPAPADNAIYPGAVFPSTPLYRPQIDVLSQRPFFTSQIPNSSSFNGNIPGVIPLLGSHQHKPENSNVDASPQNPAPNGGEFPPSFSTTDTQQPWKPIFLHSPGTASTDQLNRPSITLLPPHHGSVEGTDSFAVAQGSHNRPAQAHNHGSVDASNINNYFNNLSADEFRQFLAQAQGQATFTSNQGHRGYHY